MSFILVNVYLPLVTFSVFPPFTSFLWRALNAGRQNDPTQLM